jgi:glycosyltransferase involved in cell wall biosynthesis
MKILWVKSDLLHPTTKGGHIRTLEMLRRMHQRHEIHYAAFGNDPAGEGARRSAEYCTRLSLIPHTAPKRTSPAFAAQLLKGVFSPLPVAVFRYRSRPMTQLLGDLVARERFDSIVCDFITPAVNFPSLSSTVIFQHNVETMIWRRHAENARNKAEEVYLQMQARRMFSLERTACQSARHVIAVSSEDARLMREMFGLKDVSSIPTGVDVERFTPAQESPRAGLVFVGSMDWLPNIDGMRFFCDDVLPLIRRRRPDCRLAIVGREPTREIRAFAERDPLIEVTGTVDDVRPYLWNAAVSIVPLRIGGGTRMKIYEAMASRVPVVSTAVGAEGLDIHPPHDIAMADTAADFAARCVELLDNPAARTQQAEAAWKLVAANFGWDGIARQFESILESHPAHPARAEALPA